MTMTESECFDARTELDACEGKKMDRLSCGTCKHFKNVGYQHWGECTAQVPSWAWGEYIETTRQVFRDGSTADFAPDCEAYTPNAHALAEERSDDSQQRVVGGLNHEERP